MNYAEFKAWFDGLTVGVGEGQVPSLAQWQLLKSKVKTLDEDEQNSTDTSVTVRMDDEKESPFSGEIIGEPGESLESVMRRAMEEIEKQRQAHKLDKQDSHKEDWVKKITGELPQSPYDFGVDYNNPLDSGTWPLGEDLGLDDLNGGEDGIKAYRAEEFGLPPGMLFEIHGEQSHEEILRKVQEMMKQRGPDKGNKKLH